MSNDTIDLRARYYDQIPDPGLDCREENFVRRDVRLPLPATQTALVLVDVWSVHHVESFVERADRVCREGVAPLAASCRRAGVLVVHAPSPRITRKLGRKPATPAPTAAGAGESWPPAEFKARAGEYARFAGMWPEVWKLWDQGLQDRLEMSPHVRVEPGDELVESRAELGELCRRKRILHLLYAGFAMNWCVLNREYGIRYLRLDGYNTVVVREAVEGLEYPDTLRDRLATELAIREVETQIGGFSCSLGDALAALKGVTARA